jgi:hypothetical protein
MREKPVKWQLRKKCCFSGRILCSTCAMDSAWLARLVYSLPNCTLWNGCSSLDIRCLLLPFLLGDL